MVDVLDNQYFLVDSSSGWALEDCRRSKTRTNMEKTSLSYTRPTLRSPRLITDQAGNCAASHGYYGFGQEATDPEQSPFSLKFTGHERDENGDVPKGVLDYMKARYCSPILGRFLSPDPVLGDPRKPQS